MNTKTLQQIAVDALDELKAENIVALDVHDLTSVTDTMIVCDARSSRHLHSLADNVMQRAKENGHRPLGMDGENSNEWVLVDLGDVVVHIMMPATRELYALEKLWSVP